MKLILLMFALMHSIHADLNGSLTRIIENLRRINDGIQGALQNNKNSLQETTRSLDRITHEAHSDVVSAVFSPPDGKVPRLLVPQMIENEKYPVESHFITTSDGYILNIFRIPYGKYGKKRNKVVFLQHGLSASASDWVLLGPKHSLGYILADDGYDVWLGNSRGNRYSRSHIKWNPDKDKEFWQFSFHEVGMTDVPETIDYILKETGERDLYYVGHSQGTTAFYVMASMRPEYNIKIKHHISLAPIAFMNHMFSPVLKLFARSSRSIAETLGGGEFLRSTGVFGSIAEAMCSESLGQVVCKNSMFALTGFSPKQLNASNIPLIMAHYPSGASTRQFEHYAQEIVSGRFCQFDFDKSKNKALYGRADPPDYDLSKISASVSLIYSSNDWLAAVEDVDRLSRHLRHVKDKYLVPISTWNHLDFIFGNDAPSVVYHKVLRILARN